jgi:monooxygenase
VTGPVAEHVDVVVVGAGLSGVAAAHYLATRRPQASFVVLEARADLGGTWDLFRYPGVRSDSDLHTYGYSFHPWRDADAIASGDRILRYLRETVDEDGTWDQIRFRHRVLALSWSSAAARWTLTVERGLEGDSVTMTASWVFLGVGYFDHDAGYQPRLRGLERFAGPVVHPQRWPAELDLAGREVLVVGSGATAVTLVPALAAAARHVTMLQRTPSYVLPLSRREGLGPLLRRLLGDERAHAVLRRRNATRQVVLWRLCRRYPRGARRVIRWVNRRSLPDGYPVDVHFNPPYDPWDQRLCIDPDGEFFAALRNGSASVVTGDISTFTERGVVTTSGCEVAADVVITATGLSLRAFGVPIEVDGQPVDVSRCLVYKGMMLSGVPNLVFALGYTNASWTLKVERVCAHFCRLLAHLDAHGYDTARPVPADPVMATRPLIELSAGYVRRALDAMPRQGDRRPWVTVTDPGADARMLRGAVTDPELRLTRSGRGRTGEGAAGQPAWSRQE